MNFENHIRHYMVQSFVALGKIPVSITTGFPGIFLNAGQDMNYYTWCYYNVKKGLF